ncbi:apolipoprotein N-acyltransferase [Streptomyces iconiensis]|uniref:Apolipoprotein N-acyltransferase n=2 Tax=Streptomyces iconiensis TaxID=1384038 RepID=A0ABT6ZQM0_9ACTN|nr:apolipoprotein N-acyltransferase [Streptomyces iconiensis]MDJ1131346.1 apolipoprotein N-acyltransferase [Streptomyces iconiensis]
MRRLLALGRREAPRTALAALAGVALALAFPPTGLWPLSLVAVAAFSLLTRGRSARQGAWLGLAFGWPFFIVLLKWLHVVGWDVVVGLAFLQGLFLALLGAVLAVTSRLPVWPLWGACLWVCEEFLRDRLPFGGFPWGRLAFANTGSPFTPLAALGGAPLVTFAVALTGTLLAATALMAWRLRAEAARTARTYGTGLAALLAAAAVMAAGYAVPVPTKAADNVRIAVVQGNVQQPGMDFLGRPMKILNNHVKATLDLAERVKQGKEQKPDLVIWPENASDLDPFKWPEAGDRIDKAVKAIGVPVLVGALVDHPTKKGYVENQGIVWDPKKGAGATYTKQHPVPFGEYVPFRDQLSKVITRLQRVPRDFYPGDHTGVLQTGPARLGDVICFEVAYDEIPRDTVNDGARALVVQTNNATYGNTGQPEQQLVMSKLRAVEHGRAVVTAAPSGISAVVAPDGTIQQRTEEFTQDVITSDLPLRDEITLADRVGAAPEWVIAIVGVLSCAAAWILGRRRRDGRPAQPAPGTQDAPNPQNAGKKQVAGEQEQTRGTGQTRTTTRQQERQARPEGHEQ